MKKQVFISVFTLCSIIAGAQPNDPVIMRINGKDIKKSEFEYIYNKNSKDEVIDKKTLTEYVDLFKNFKLKVTQAEEQKLDTTEAFRRELNEYREQLARQYISDFPLDEQLLKQKYDRTQTFYDISHIVISIPLKNGAPSASDKKNILPEDTVEAYKKVMQIRKRLLKGEDFVKVAKEVSNDEQSLKNDIPGHLGKVTALMIPPVWEDAIYATEKGKISMPVRSNLGYHLFKVNDIMPNPGQIHVAHIMINCPPDADSATTTAAKEKIERIYSQLKTGADFAETAKKESNDQQTANMGGELPWLGYGNVIKEFQDAAFDLKEIGSITNPVRTAYGFHIIKLLGRKQIGSFEEKREEMIKTLDRSTAYMQLHKPGLEKLKKDNGFSLNEKTYKLLFDASVKAYPTDSAFTTAFETNKDVLMLTGNTPYTIADFISFIKKNQMSPFVLSTEYLDERLYTFENQNLYKSEDDNLESKYPDFRNLMNEYKDGILLFEISNNEVWDKAGKDTEGLSAYFKQNKNKYNWDEPHYKGYIVHCKDLKTKKRMSKEITGMTPDSAASYLLENYRVGDVSYVKLEKGLYKKGDNAIVDELVFKTGKGTPSEDLPEYFVVGKSLPNGPDEYMDVRGLVITDYQNYLEKQWLDQLNKKYSVTINQDVVNTLK